MTVFPSFSLPSSSPLVTSVGSSIEHLSPIPCPYLPFAYSGDILLGKCFSFSHQSFISQPMQKRIAGLSRGGEIPAFDPSKVILKKRGPAVDRAGCEPQSSLLCFLFPSILRL